MIEHRLIERMVRILERKAASIETGGRPQARPFAAALDFFRSYADRCHHGKEEDIFFRALRGKPMSAEHARTVEDLIAEHVKGRGLVDTLAELHERRMRNGDSVLPEIAAAARMLTGFYRAHIAKEDKCFFAPTQKYFTREEQARMLDRFRDFDALLIHERYMQTVAELE